jgi:3-oxoacyl-[acyl-carrier protein] reductase
MSSTQCDAIENTKKTILITAATGALGEAISEMLAREGHNLVLAGRNQIKLHDLQNRLHIKFQQVNIQTLIIDFSDIKTIQNAADTLLQKTLDGLVLIGPRPSLNKDGIPVPNEWNNAFLETFISPLEVVRSFSSRITDQSSIVVISGNSSSSYLPNYPNTNVLRLMWVGEIKNLMHFFAQRKIRVNAISPGPILTQFHIKRITQKAQVNHLSFEKQLIQETSAIPLKEYGSTTDVAYLVSFLLSEKSMHINGTNTLLDGGESNAY